MKEIAWKLRQTVSNVTDRQLKLTTFEQVPHVRRISRRRIRPSRYKSLRSLSSSSKPQFPKFQQSFPNFPNVSTVSELYENRLAVEVRIKVSSSESSTI